ncbi:hypothetical protein CI733_13080 [Escherichia coli]|uniref:hypothetical protein n=1 Tax=Escherichia coli TaxID=562 RepID=UPI000B959C20|nr:hypothetical protein [Escherichia coli]MDQ8066547.1 hypothetical protein [Escherichia coli]OYG60789.1 hypothetical protein CI733_13080 [Escherichia coli]
MESNIKGLVSAGHEMASELKAECGAVDMRSVAKLLSDLATQLEVQLVRANALAAENAALKESERAFDAMCAEEHGDNWVSELTETPATDAFLSEVRAQAFNDLCSAFVKHANLAGMDDGELVRLKYATDALLHCADQIRKGVQS